MDDLDARLARLSARAGEAVASTGDLEMIRQEAARIRAVLGERPGVAAQSRKVLAEAEAEAAEIRARARSELSAAQEEARLVRERVYAEALQARREFEAGLQARRRREARVDEILRGVGMVPADTPTAAAASTHGGSR